MGDKQLDSPNGCLLSINMDDYNVKGVNQAFFKA